MKKFRFSIVLVVLALVLATVSAAFAQDDTLGASQGDYTLWTTANASFATVKTASYSFTAMLDASGMGDSNGSVSLSGTGVFSTDQANPEFQLDVTGTTTQGTTTTPVNAGLRIVSGNLYLNDGTGWKGQPLSQAMSGISSNFMNGISGGSGAATPEAGGLSSLTGMQGMSEAMTALEGLKPSDFLKLTRADEGGQAHFTLNVDVAKLLASPALAGVFKTVLSMSSGSSGANAPAMTDAQVTQMQGMIGGMFSTATVSFDEYVDPASSMVGRAVVAVNLPLDIVGPGAALKVNFDISLTNYNAPISVEAPADAIMATPAA